MPGKVNLAIFCESKHEWKWLEPMTMSDAVRMTVGSETRAWTLNDETGYIVAAGGVMHGDLVSKYRKSLRALKSRGEIKT